jgi:23S rRNA pseudouridine1911/1915/1917 synthase
MMATPPGGEQPLSDRLQDMFPEASGRRIKVWLAAGRVRVNGRVTRDGRLLVAADDAVMLHGHRARYPPAPLPGLRILYEDEQILVIDKPPGLLTIATERERARTAYHWLWEYLAAQRPSVRPFIVHRLDRDTSGLLVFAKTWQAKVNLQAQFSARSVQRVYVALVEGRVTRDAGTLTSRLLQDRSLRVRSRRGLGASAAVDGTIAISHFRVLRRGQAVSLLEIRLGTGRRQQIRAQLAEFGHPILGDAARTRRRDPVRRLCLHATRLAFAHPVDATWMRFESSPPAIFSRLVGRTDRDQPRPSATRRGPPPAGARSTAGAPPDRLR